MTAYGASEFEAIGKLARIRSEREPPAIAGAAYAGEERQRLAALHAPSRRVHPAGIGRDPNEAPELRGGGLRVVGHLGSEAGDHRARGADRERLRQDLRQPGLEDRCHRERRPPAGHELLQARRPDHVALQPEVHELAVDPGDLAELAGAEQRCLDVHLAALPLELSADEYTRLRTPCQPRRAVVDTTLAAFSIQNWNDSGDVTRVTSAMARVARETGATVLGVHHHGKDVSRGPAGSYALTAAADFIVSVLCDGDVEGNVDRRRIAVTKQREGETGWGCEFTLRRYKIGTDEHGEDVESAYLQPEQVTAGPSRSRRNSTRRQSGSSAAFMGALAAALDGHGRDRPSSDGPPARMVAVQRVREAFDERYDAELPAGKQGRGVPQGLRPGAARGRASRRGHRNERRRRPLAGANWDGLAEDMPTSALDRTSRKEN